MASFARPSTFIWFKIQTRKLFSIAIDSYSRDRIGGEHNGEEGREFLDKSEPLVSLLFFSINIKNAHKRDSSKSTRSVYPASNDYFRAGRKFLHHCTVVSCRDRFNIANESLLSRAATSYFENIFPYCNSVSIAMMIKTIKMIITSTINEEFQSPSSTK